MTSRISFSILRVGLGITFLWIGILILKNPSDWVDYINLWAANLSPISLEKIMIVNAIFNIFIGFLFLIDYLILPVSILASLNLIIILMVSGITEITVRDIAILSGLIALLIENLPLKIKNKIFRIEF